MFFMKWRFIVTLARVKSGGELGGFEDIINKLS